MAEYKPAQPSVRTYVRIFLVPTLFLKAAILYFGLNYSSYPGRGYGYGLAISIIFSMINFGIFVYTFRNHIED